MKTAYAAAIVTLLALGLVNAAQGPWDQCGGADWTGDKTCVSGHTCTYIEEYYSECQPSTGAHTGANPEASSNIGTKTPTTAGPTPTSSDDSDDSDDSDYSDGSEDSDGDHTPAASGSPSPTSPGGHTPASSGGPTPASDYSDYSDYSNGSDDSDGSEDSDGDHTPTASGGPTPTSSGRPTPTSSGSPIPTASDSEVPQQSAGNLKFVGINIAGFDFGCTSDGTCDPARASPPLSSIGGPDGIGQMQHFYNDDKFNTFRLPVGWQWLVNSKLGGALDADKFDKYDQLMQGCLQTGASCIIDVHNYARWNGGIIGQGGPTDAQFASLWSNLAAKYKAEDRIIFGLMNEPHNVPDLNRWAQTLQVVVTAIRDAGAATNMILLPGNVFSSAAACVSSGSATALGKVTNPDGSKTNLVFDVHQYSDSDSTGTHTECVTNKIADFRRLTEWLRSNGRQALYTEMGGGNTDSCAKYICEQVKFLSDNPDIYLGYTAWAAGSFRTSYPLSLTPTHEGDKWIDTSLVSSCLKPQ